MKEVLIDFDNKSPVDLNKNINITAFLTENDDVEYNNSEMNEFIENTMRKYSKGKMIHNIDRNIEIIKLSLFYGLTESDISNKLDNEITSQTIGRIIRRFRDWAKIELTK